MWTSLFTIIIESIPTVDLRNYDVLFFKPYSFRLVALYLTLLFLVHSVHESFGPLLKLFSTSDYLSIEVNVKKLETQGNSDTENEPLDIGSILLGASLKGDDDDSCRREEHTFLGKLRSLYETTRRIVFYYKGNLNAIAHFYSHNFATADIDHVVTDSS